jgi:ethanolaminephosphotransferase
MSSTASNYDMTKLVTGQAAATLATAFAVAAASPTIMKSLISFAPFCLVTLAYGAMMFASSYVEEEQHFWSWAASGWLLVLSLKRFVKIPVERIAADT